MNCQRCEHNIHQSESVFLVDGIYVCYMCKYQIGVKQIMSEKHIIEWQARQVLNKDTQIKAIMKRNAHLESVATRVGDFVYSLQVGDPAHLFELAEAMDWVAPKPMDGDITHNWVSAVKWVANRIWPE